jgi:hypothetical protein
VRVLRDVILCVLAFKHSLANFHEPKLFSTCHPHYSLEVKVGANFRKSVNVHDNLHVYDDLSVDGSSTFDGDATFNHLLKVQGTYGRLEVHGPAEFYQTATFFANILGVNAEFSGYVIIVHILPFAVLC